MELLESEEATFLAGQKIGQGLRPNDVVALVGDLGAGKTHLAKGIVFGLGCAAEVSSPTFGLAHEYPGGRLPAFHFDFYRVESERELIELGWDDYLERDGVVIVEWADKFPAVLPTHAQWWRLGHDHDSRSRRLERIAP